MKIFFLKTYKQVNTHVLQKFNQIEYLFIKNREKRFDSSICTVTIVLKYMMSPYTIINMFDEKYNFSFHP